MSDLRYHSRLNIVWNIDTVRMDERDSIHRRFIRRPNDASLPLPPNPIEDVDIIVFDKPGIQKNFFVAIEVDFFHREVTRREERIQHIQN
jgi:hypothetical protein